MITWRSFIDSPDRGYWDQTMLTDLLVGVDYADITVTPGHWRSKPDIPEDHLVLITSDEEGECPFWLLPNPVWKMTPNPQLAHRPDRAIPLGYTPHTRPNLEMWDVPEHKKGWTFSGQVTNSRRHSAMEALRKLGTPHETDAFASGLSQEDYIKTLYDAEWVPCPAGNVRPETFRMWEALEAGAVPILDATSPHGDLGYWPRVIGEHPFPVMADWSQVGDYLSEPAPLTEAAVWYSQFKYHFKRDLWNAWAHMVEGEPWTEPPNSRIMAIVTASEIPSHPDFGILAETVKSISERLDCRIIVAFDGPREPNNDYAEHIRRFTYWANLYEPNVTVFYDGKWRHQAGTIREVLPMVYPDYACVLMMEHDTPLTGDIDFDRVASLLYLGHFNSIRFHHEDVIPPEHNYLMHGHFADSDFGVIKTTQYSQRPHLARLSYYREMMGQLDTDARTYVEDWWYGRVTSDGWDSHKLGIYAPRGGLRRSLHLDGRAGEPKGKFWF